MIRINQVLFINMDSQALPLEIPILKLRQVGETLGLLFPWRCFRLRADFKGPFPQRLCLLSVGGDCLLESISYHCMDPGSRLLACLSKGGSGGDVAKAQPRQSYETATFLFVPHPLLWSSFLSSSISSAQESFPLCLGCVSWLSEHLFFILFLFLDQCQPTVVCAN